MEISADGVGLSPERSPGALGMPRAAQQVWGAEPALLAPGQGHPPDVLLPLVSGTWCQGAPYQRRALGCWRTGALSPGVGRAGLPHKTPVFPFNQIVSRRHVCSRSPRCSHQGEHGAVLCGAGCGCRAPQAGRAGGIKALPGEVACRDLHTRLPAEMQTAEMWKSVGRVSMKSRGRLGRGEPGQVGRAAARYERGGKRTHRIF